MAEKGPMARMQLLLPPDREAGTVRVCRGQGLPAGEAIRGLARSGLEVSGQEAPDSVLVDELGYRARDLNHGVAKQEGAGA